MDVDKNIRQGRQVEIIIEELGYNEVEHIDFVELDRAIQTIKGSKIELETIINGTETEGVEDIDAMLYNEDNINSITVETVLE